MVAAIKEERLEKNLKDKLVYYYYDSEKKIRELSKEEFKSRDEIVHYPRAFNGGPRYKTIRRFIFKEFKKKLPVGVLKAASYGYGFTKTMNAFAFFVNEKYDLNEVIFEKGGKTGLDVVNKKLYLSEKSIETIQNNLSTVIEKNRNDTNEVLLSTLHNLFPKQIAKPQKKYAANTLSGSLAKWGHSINEFSEEDKTAIKNLFEKLSVMPGFLNHASLSKTKEIIDNKYIQQTLDDFQKLFALGRDTDILEKKWQAFLKDNNWIFSTIFAQPVILYKDEAYVGGKNIDNQNGKFNDFLIKNSLSNNVSFLEIKTHLTPLLEKKPYRGEDVFSTTKELTGCIGQVLNQRDNFQKEFYQTKGKTKEEFESFNSKCIVLIGSIERLTDKQKYAFELFRSNSRDVEIITFDELKMKIEGLQKIMNPVKAKIARVNRKRAKSKK